MVEWLDEQRPQTMTYEGTPPDPLEHEPGQTYIVGDRVLRLVRMIDDRTWEYAVLGLSEQAQRERIPARSRHANAE